MTKIPGLKIDATSNTPVYRQIAEGIREALRDGRLAHGHRLPPTRELARQLSVNRNTVVAAYEALAAEGRVTSHTGRGTFLTVPNGGPSDDRAREADSWFTSFSRAVEGRGVTGLRAVYQIAVSSEGISFAGSYPAAELMPTEAFRHALDEVLRERGSELLSYGPTGGYAPLREAIAAGMRRRGSRVLANDVLITNGSQQALDLLFRAMLDRGDPVVVEDPTYTGAISVLSSLGARVIGVPLDEEGIRADLLEIAFEQHHPRLLYVQPTFQNPTTRVMSERRRREVLALALRHRCSVVEDDWAADLRFSGRDLPTLHAMGEGRHVIYVSTFSKNLLPGLRVGWIAAPPPVLDRLTALKQIEDNGSSPLLQAALHAFLRDGGLERHLLRIRPAYRERSGIMLAALERHFPGGVSWSRPEGGLFLWARLPEGLDSDELFVAATEKRVLFSRGSLFHATGSGADAIRLTYASVRPAQIEAGIAVLGGLIRDMLPGRAGAAAKRTGDAVPIL